MNLNDLPMHKDTYVFKYGIDIEKPIEMANEIIKLQQEKQELINIINKALELNEKVIFMREQGRSYEQYKPYLLKQQNTLKSIK